MIKKMLLRLADARPEASLSEAVTRLGLFDFKMGQGLTSFLVRSLYEEGPLPLASSHDWSSSKTVLDVVLSSEQGVITDALWQRDMSVLLSDLPTTLGSLAHFSSWGNVREFIQKALQRVVPGIECVGYSEFKNQVRFYLDDAKPHIVSFRVQGGLVTLKVPARSFSSKESVFEFVRTYFPGSSDKHIFQI